MTTVTQLADLVQYDLNDAGATTWPQATVENWVMDAIRDYSQYFPRILLDGLDDVGASPEHFVELPAYFIEMITVEFPYGNDPPTYLERRSIHHPQFWEVDGYYDILYIEEDNTDPSPEPLGKLMFSRQPVDDEGYRMRFFATHEATSGGSDVTVPTDHHPILHLYVIWQAFKERVATHLQDPDMTSDILQKMVNAETQAHNEYRAAIKNAQNKRAQGGWTGPWRTDAFDPIY